MNGKRIWHLGLAVVSLVAVSSVASASLARAHRRAAAPSTLVETVRTATAQFRSLDAATAAGYSLLHGCVAGPQGGGMGVHYVNPDLVGDGALDPMHPEALIYEFHNGQAELVGVEYIVLADAWDSHNDAPPVLMGQLLQYQSSPNRYRLPGFYELHVWAWKANPSGTFADWNPAVSCDDYAPPADQHDMDMGQ